MKRTFAFAALIILIGVSALYFLSKTDSSAPESKTETAISSPEEAQTLWVSAESAGSPEAQREQWERLYHHRKTLLPHLPHITEKTIFYRYFNALLMHAETSADASILQTALDIIPRSEILSEQETWWAKLEIARGFAKLMPLNAIKQLSSLQQSAYHDDPLERSARLHGLGVSWLIQDNDRRYMLGDDAATSAELLLPDITTYRHYHLLHRAILSASGHINGAEKPQHQQLALSAYNAGHYSHAITHTRLANNRPEGDLALSRWAQQAARDKRWWLAEMFTFPIETGHMRSAAFGTLAKHYARSGYHEKTKLAIKEAYFAALSSRYKDKQERGMVRFVEDAAQTGGGAYYQHALAWLESRNIDLPKIDIIPFPPKKDAPHPGATSLSEADILARITKDTLPKKDWAIALLKQFNTLKNTIKGSPAPQAQTPLSSAPIIYNGSSNAVMVEPVNPIAISDFTFAHDDKITTPSIGLYSQPDIAILPMSLNDWVPKTISQHLDTHTRSIKQPHMIMLMRGSVSLKQLAQTLTDYHNTELIEYNGATARLKAPLFIAPNASLHITAQEQATLSLSAEQSAFIINAGTLIIKNIMVTSHGHHPHMSPFLLSWDSGIMQLENNSFSKLGFNLPYARGITLTGGKKDKRTLPHSLITHNLFDAVHTPISFYNAQGGKVLGNIVTGAKTHGIELSKSQDISIASNLIIRNERHGIRVSEATNTHIANNIVTHNENGIDVQKSTCSLIEGNHFQHLKGSAVKAKASDSLAVFYNNMNENTVGAIELTKADDGSLTSLLLAHNHISSNGVGMKTDGVGALYLASNDWRGQSPRLTEGEWWKRQPSLRRHISSKSAIYLHLPALAEKADQLAHNCQ